MNNFVQGLRNYAQKSAGFSAGLLIGGLLGAGAMLLLAPHSGKRTRVTIQQKSIQLRDQTTVALESLIGQTNDSVRKQMKDLQHSRKDVMEEQRKRLSTLVDAGKKAIQGPELPINTQLTR